MNKGRDREAHEHRETGGELNHYLAAAEPPVLQPRYGEIKGEYVLADAVHICEILDLEPTYIRTGLQMWRERVSKDNKDDGRYGG